MTDMGDGWVAGWQSDGISDESAVEQDFEDAAEIIQDLLHQELFDARDLSELDDFEEASQLLDNAPDAEPFEVRVNGSRFYVRETTERDQPRYLGRHHGDDKGWSL